MSADWGRTEVVGRRRLETLQTRLSSTLVCRRNGRHAAWRAARLAAQIAESSKEEKAMAKQLPKTDTSAVNVADYIVERLAAEGIDHCFGVAGDYAFPICDAVDSSAKVKWIGWANELNASYAADGYGRIRRAGHA